MRAGLMKDGIWWGVLCVFMGRSLDTFRWQADLGVNRVRVFTGLSLLRRLSSGRLSML